MRNILSSRIYFLKIRSNVCGTLDMSARALSSSHFKNKEEHFRIVHAENYVSLNFFQRTALAVGISLANPARGDMIATLGETTGTCALENILRKMEANCEGNQILRERPRINSRTINLHELETLPEGTLGRAYCDFLSTNNVSPDTRAVVQFVDDIDLAYVMQRYREVHDLFHTVLQMKTNMLGEVAVKWVEAIQTHLPMCIGGALLGSVRLSRKQRQQYISQYLPWAIQTGWESKFLMNVYFEKRWDQSLKDLQKELNIFPLR